MSRGQITFVFDDGYEVIYKNVVPVLDEYKMLGVFAVALDNKAIESTEKRPVVPWEKWLSLKAQGHEIAAHSVSHRNLTKLSLIELNHELTEPAQKLGASTIIYPGGAFNETVINTTKTHYTAGRAVKKGFEKLTPRDPMQLKTYNFTRTNFSVTKANMLALWAWLTNSWLIETYHMVDDNETEVLHSVRLSDFKKHLSFIHHLPVKVITIQDAI